MLWHRFQVLCSFVAEQGQWLCTHGHVPPAPGLGATGTGFPGPNVAPGWQWRLFVTPSSWEHLWNCGCGSVGRERLRVRGGSDSTGGVGMETPNI